MRNPFAKPRKSRAEAWHTAGAGDEPAPRRVRRAKPAVPPKPFNGERAIAGLLDLPKGTRLVLPWPPAQLNPNRRGHPAKKAPFVKAYREMCWGLALEAFGVGAGKTMFPGDGKIPVRLDFFPPTGQARDDDNCASMFKAGRDGVAKALGIDDGRFRTTPNLRPEVRGCVVMTFLETDAA